MYCVYVLSQCVTDLLLQELSAERQEAAMLSGSVIAKYSCAVGWNIMELESLGRSRDFQSLLRGG